MHVYMYIPVHKVQLYMEIYIASLNWLLILILVFIIFSCKFTE